MNKEQIIELIRMGNLADAIKHVSKMGEKGLVISSRYAALQKQEMAGSISYSDANVTRSQIISAIFSLLDHSPEMPIETTEQLSNTNKPITMNLGSQFETFITIMGLSWNDAVTTDHTDEFNEIISKFRHEFSNHVKGRQSIDFQRLQKEIGELMSLCEKSDSVLFNPIKEKIGEMLEQSKPDKQEIISLLKLIDESRKMTNELRSFYESINEYEGSKMEVRMLKEYLLRQLRKF